MDCNKFKVEMDAKKALTVRPWAQNTESIVVFSFFFDAYNSESIESYNIMACRTEALEILMTHEKLKFNLGITITESPTTRTKRGSFKGRNIFIERGLREQLLFQQRRQRILARQIINLLLQLHQLWVPRSIPQLGLPILQLVGLFGQRLLNVGGDLDCAVDIVDDFDEFGFGKAAGCHGGGTDSDSSGVDCAGVYANDQICKRGFFGGLPEGRVFLLQAMLIVSRTRSARAPSAPLGLVARRTMCESPVSPRSWSCDTGSTRGKIVSTFLEFLFQDFGVLNHLMRILFELGRQSLSQRDGKGSNSMIVRTSLMSRKHTKIDLVLQIIHNRFQLPKNSLREHTFASLVRLPYTFAVKDHGAARST
jgi:hypothetical protein